MYIIGEPGVGKSTLAAELVRGRRRRVRVSPFGHTVYEDGLVQLGRERGTGFSGTDALSMSVQPKVVAALEAGLWDRVLGEGDRLANQKFFTAVEAAGYELTVVLLGAPDHVLVERREGRGSDQSTAWLSGRKTKVQHLKHNAGIVLDATRPVRDLAAELSTHPVLSSNPQGG